MASLDGGPSFRIEVLDLGTRDRKLLVADGGPARYAPSGHLVYGRRATLHAVAFDLDGLAVRGDPVPVIEGVAQTADASSGSFSLASGTLVYVAQSRRRNTLAWVDRQGREEPTGIPVGTYNSLRLSPDGARIAVWASMPESGDIWIWDLDGQTMRRLTRDPETNRGPVWTPDGKRVAFSVVRGGTENTYWQASDGLGVAEPLTEGSRQIYPTAFSPDGKRLVVQLTRSPTDIGMVTLNGGRQIEWLLQTSAGEQDADISSDGRWIAYASDETGRREVYVRPFPAVAAGTWPVSTAGGSQPVWARDGRELFYRTPSGTLMAVPVTASGSAFVAGAPRELSKVAVLDLAIGRHYDVSPDGQRFLVIKDVRMADETSQLIVVQNWHEELKRLVPRN